MLNSMNQPSATRVRVCAGDMDFSAKEPRLLGLAHIDLLVQQESAIIDPVSIFTSTEADSLLTVGASPDVLVGADAGSLRMHLAMVDIQKMPWISLAKVSYGLNSSAHSHALPGLVEQFGVSAALLERVGDNPNFDDAMTETLAAALVFAAMLAEGVPLRRLLLLSQIITEPYLPLPALNDDIGWRFVPDDVLRGLQVCSNYGFPEELVARACFEESRRLAAGHKPDLSAKNWQLPGMDPYRPEESYDQDRDGPLIF